MSSKVLVTKKFHRRALRAIEKVNKLEALRDKKMDLLRLAWMSFMDDHCDDELLDKFAEYCEKHQKELGLQD